MVEYSTLGSLLLVFNKNLKIFVNFILKQNVDQFMPILRVCLCHSLNSIHLPSTSIQFNSIHFNLRVWSIQCNSIHQFTSIHLRLSKNDNVFIKSEVVCLFPLGMYSTDNIANY